MCYFSSFYSLPCSSHPLLLSLSPVLVVHTHRPNSVRVQKKSIRHGLVLTIFLMTIFSAFLFSFPFRLCNFRFPNHSQCYFCSVFCFSNSLCGCRICRAIWNTNVSAWPSVCVASLSKIRPQFYEHTTRHHTLVCIHLDRAKVPNTFIYGLEHILRSMRSFNRVL